MFFLSIFTALASAMSDIAIFFNTVFGTIGLIAWMIDLFS